LSLDRTEDRLRTIKSTCLDQLFEATSENLKLMF